MAVIIEVDLDTQGAQADLNALQDELANGLGKAAEKGGAEFEKALEKYTKRAQKNIQSFGQKAGFDLQAAFKELPGLLGDAGDAVELLSKNFGVLNKEQAETLSNAAGLMEKFGQLGGQLGGPWGAALGVAVGGLVALKKELNDTEHAARRMQLALGFLPGKTKEDLAKWIEEQKKAKEESDRLWAGITSAGGLAQREGLSDGAKKLAEDFGFLEKKVKGAGKAAKEAKGPFDDLFAAFDKADKARDAVRKLNAEVEAMLERDFGAASPVLPDMEVFGKAWLEAGVRVENFAKEAEQLTIYEDTALAVAEAWGTHALGGFEKFLDGVQAGNKIIGSMDWDEALVNFLRLTGSQLMASGLQHELAAAAAWFLGNKKDATGLALVGAAELATGAAMGGTGALVGRRRGIGGGGGGDRFEGGGNFSLGRNANTTNNTNNTSNTYIIQALDIGDRELWERLGARVERARGAFRRAGGKLLDGRN
jgi:hypothetical protein